MMLTPMTDKELSWARKVGFLKSEAQMAADARRLSQTPRADFRQAMLNEGLVRTALPPAQSCVQLPPIEYDIQAHDD